MAEYQAKSNDSLSFDLTKDDKLIGKLSYEKWFKFNAIIEIGNSTNYQVEPKGFWGTTIEIRDKEKLLVKFKMDWSGAIVVQTYFKDLEKDYMFKHKGFFKESFALTDQEGNQLLIMKPDFKWNKMNYEYQITTSDIFDTFSNKEILLMNSLHCANYYMSMVSSTGV